MAAETDWFYEDELSRLRWEWVAALREYGRGESPDRVRRLEIARDAYVGRATKLRTSQQVPDQEGRGTSSTQWLLHTY